MGPHAMQTVSSVTAPRPTRRFPCASSAGDPAEVARGIPDLSRAAELCELSEVLCRQVGVGNERASDIGSNLHVGRLDPRDTTKITEGTNAVDRIRVQVGAIRRPTTA